MQVADWARTATRRADSWRIIWAPVGPSPRSPGITWPSLACDAELAHERGGVDEPQCSQISPSSVNRQKSALLTRKGLRVAGMPMNSPWWLPLTLVKALTRSLPATIRSVVNRRSGNALISTVISFLNPAWPAVNSGGKVGSLSDGQW